MKFNAASLLVLLTLLSVAFAGIDLVNNKVVTTIIDSDIKGWGNLWFDLLFSTLAPFATAWCAMEGLFGLLAANKPGKYWNMCVSGFYIAVYGGNITIE